MSDLLFYCSTLADRLGLSGTQILYRWKKQMMAKIGPVADTLDTRVQELERELRRVERERDILKKALAIIPIAEVNMRPLCIGPRFVVPACVKA